MSSPEVAIVQRRLTDYRVPLFNELKRCLASDGINLRLLYGDASPSELSKNDGGHLPWGEKLATSYVLGDRICWQPFAHEVKNADLVIVTQENKLVCNLFPLLLRRNYLLAFWGHGANLQSQAPNGYPERFKRWTTTKADWWFAYTQSSAMLVAKQGFPSDRITTLENAVDTTALRREVDALQASDLEEARNRLGLSGKAVALFLGSLYPEKRIDFLLEAASLIHDRLPHFQLLIGGDGPLRDEVQRRTHDAPWLRYLGRLQGRDKAIALRLADVFLNPGLVGLGILDSFIGQCPLVTTDCRIHSPEIDYLEHNRNGLITENSLIPYVTAAIGVLQDSPTRRRLQAGCAVSSQRYTIENMANRFAVGICSALRSTS